MDDPLVKTIVFTKYSTLMVKSTTTLLWRRFFLLALDVKRNNLNNCYAAKHFWQISYVFFSDSRDFRREQIDHLVPHQAGPARHGLIQSCVAHLHFGAKIFSGKTIWLLLPRGFTCWVRINQVQTCITAFQITSDPF